VRYDPPIWVVRGQRVNIDLDHADVPVVEVNYVSAPTTPAKE